jgi:hypothetical protein
LEIHTFLIVHVWEELALKTRINTNNTTNALVFDKFVVGSLLSEIYSIKAYLVLTEDLFFENYLRIRELTSWKKLLTDVKSAKKFIIQNNYWFSDCKKKYWEIPSESFHNKTHVNISVDYHFWYAFHIYVVFFLYVQ